MRTFRNVVTVLNVSMGVNERAFSLVHCGEPGKYPVVKE